jgi:hypothetical protein
MQSERCHECGNIWVQSGPREQWRFPVHYVAGAQCRASGKSPDRPLLELIESVLDYCEMVSGVDDHPRTAVYLLARFRETVHGI